MWLWLCLLGGAVWDILCLGKGLPSVRFLSHGVPPTILISHNNPFDQKQQGIIVIIITTVDFWIIIWWFVIPFPPPSCAEMAQCSLMDYDWPLWLLKSEDDSPTWNKLDFFLDFYYIRRQYRSFTLSVSTGSLPCGDGA